MSLKTLPALAMRCPAGREDAVLALPADEQLAWLLRVAGPAPATDHSSGSAAPQALPLAEAYRICQKLTRHHSKSFFFSTQLLPADKRRAIRALYAFCRSTDDTVDVATGDPARALATWVVQARAAEAPPQDPVLQAWFDTRLRYNLSALLIDELLAGVAMDLAITRYTSFADLWLYCYRVASVVGLLSMEIMGSAPGAVPYAIKLGVALQMTNILRDVGEDAQRGRVYLPQEDLERFGLSTDDILARTYDQRFCTLMQFEIERTRRLYAESWPGIALLPADSRLAVGAAARVYEGILDKITANRYDVFSKRAHLKFREKIGRLPQIWRDVKRLEWAAAQQA